MLLPNNEGLTIEITESICNLCSIIVNGYSYAQFQNASIEDINLDNLVNWIENTYYSNDYQSSAFISMDLRLEEFTI